MEDNDYRITVGGRTVVGISTWSISTVVQADRIDLGDKVNMEKSQVAELVLDARSLWQMYYVEGVVAQDYKDDDFWDMKSEMAVLAGLNKYIEYGCPFCDHFAEEGCSGCPLDWPKKLFDYFYTKCEQAQSPYRLWKHAECIEEARTYSNAMIKLCEKWLDENKITYEK
jgi:hypothetical protein